MDGSVSWKKFEQMIFIHSWNPGGSRQYYAYQEDLGDYGKSGRIVKPRYCRLPYAVRLGQAGRSR